MTGAPGSRPDLFHEASRCRRPGRWRTAVRWFGRLYVALACVQAAGVVVELFLGNGALAVRCAAFGLAWLLLGGVLIGATRLNWPERSLTDIIPTRPLSKEDAHRLFPRWLLA